MRVPSILMPLSCSLALHAAMFGGAAISSAPQIELQDGESALRVSLRYVAPNNVANDRSKLEQQVVEFARTISTKRNAAVSDPSTTLQPTMPKDFQRSAQGVDTPLQMHGLTVPEYPDSARKRGFFGDVTYDVLVTSEGRVGAITLVESSGYHILDNAAKRALEEVSFTPAFSGGKPISSSKRVCFSFQLRG